LMLIDTSVRVRRDCRYRAEPLLTQPAVTPLGYIG